MHLIAFINYENSATQNKLFFKLEDLENVKKLHEIAKFISVMKKDYKNFVNSSISVASFLPAPVFAPTTAFLNADSIDCPQVGQSS